MLNPVASFILKHQNPQKEIMLFLHDYFLSKEGVTTRISYKIPFYYGNKWLCYLNPLKNGSVDLCFCRGYKLSNKEELLNMKGRKYISSLNLTDFESIPFEGIASIFEEAMMLDQNL
ncbi:MAG: DUF1801 domain-containing protein [Flavobacteriales bacterium]|nr:DUF1801 domain-containing protein [Flavobacteriales bacterium]